MDQSQPQIGEIRGTLFEIYSFYPQKLPKQSWFFSGWLVVFFFVKKHLPMFFLSKLRADARDDADQPWRNLPHIQGHFLEDHWSPPKPYLFKHLQSQEGIWMSRVTGELIIIMIGVAFSLSVFLGKMHFTSTQWSHFGLFRNQICTNPRIHDINTKNDGCSKCTSFQLWLFFRINPASNVVSFWVSIRATQLLMFCTALCSQ